MKKNKKRKFIKIFVGLILVVLIGYLIINLRIKNIYVKGNKLLSDQEIIELAGIEKYPKFFSVFSFKLKNRIKLNPIIEDVKIHKNIFGRVDIEIKEYNMVLKDETDKGIYLANGEKISTDETVLGIPSLINVVESNILKTFLSRLDKLDKSILSEISEIEYSPNDYEKDLFLLYMNDGNYIYVTTMRLSNMNKYNEVLKQLEGKKGILYFDSGNHFEIFE